MRDFARMALRQSERDAERTLANLREMHTRLGRPSIANFTCGLIVCPTLRVLEEGDRG